ncbi:MAG: SpoIIE family protein phosphatase [Deltaproteobacteria bacterium]|nr:MAG: SpoIIE family protein phosphatase [Deltaproteobacteria bacterium]
METLPPVHLGASILVAFLTALAVRRPLEHRFVVSKPRVAQPKRQFYFDIAMCLAAGSVVLIYNTVAYGFPVPSGITLLFGCTVVGFFLGLDMALARERKVIHEALAEDSVLPPPKRLYSMTRKFSLVAFTATIFLSLVLGLVLARDVVWLAKIEQSGMPVMQAQLSVMGEVFFVMAVLLAEVANLIISYSKNLKLLFENETSVLERVTQGDLSRLVPVATNDEFGVIAGHTNTMIDGLRHRIQLITALKLAEEVQQNLLPGEAPSIPGLDIAGISHYCDETGGDYYDYFRLSNGDLGVVVADASEHGVSAALLMTTVRAQLRQRVAMEGDIARIVSDVNQELARDVEDSGRFMTMFFLEIEPETKTMHWVRAGHEPAILYNALEDSFLELAGEGMALGVVEDLEFQKYTHTGWAPRSVVVVSTDGIREAQNDKGEMFGLDRLRESICKHAAESAETIQNTIIEDLKIFQGEAPQEDDITLVVVKLL